MVVELDVGCDENAVNIGHFEIFIDQVPDLTVVGEIDPINHRVCVSFSDLSEELVAEGSIVLAHDIVGALQLIGVLDEAGDFVEAGIVLQLLVNHIVCLLLEGGEY